jgi:hypothetical protein
MNSFKKKAFNFYTQWRKQKCYCPALKEHIVISLLGWDHITGQSGAKKRSWNDVYRRLKLLTFAKEVIEKSTTIQNISKRDKTVYYILEAMCIVSEKERKAWRKIRVILVEAKNGKKIFLSVMDKKLDVKNKKAFKKKA